VVFSSLRTATEALLSLIHQRCSNANEWHWACEIELTEDAHRDANQSGAMVVSFLRTGG
jgi:hypothetical protein